MFNNLRVEHLTKSMLREALDQNTLWNTAIAPFPRSKAAWLLANDRIEEDDYCAVLGYDGDEMIGLLFLFPDLMNTTTAPFHKKVYWMILWWVTPKYEDTIIGSYIFNEALRIANNNVLIKSYAEKVNEFYAKQPFDVITSRTRHTLFFGINANVIIGRWPATQKIKFLLDPIEKISSSVLRGINKRKLRKNLKGVRYEYLPVLDNETWEFLEPRCKNDLIHKTKSYISWQLSPAQYTTIPIENRQNQKTLLAGNSTRIKIQTLKIKQDDTILGFLSYLVNVKELNIKYLVVKEPKYLHTVVSVLMEHVIREQVNFVFTDDEQVYESLQQQYRTIFVYKKNKKGLAHRNMNLDAEQVNFYNRDGHFY